MAKLPINASTRVAVNRGPRLASIDLMAGGVADILRAQRESILVAWERAVMSDQSMPRACLSEPHLRDYIPALLDTLIEALAVRRDEDRALAAHALTAKLIPHSHARERLMQGYSLGGMLRELAHLRAQIVTVVWNAIARAPAELLDIHELEFLHGALDECMTVSAVEMEEAARLERERIVAVLGHDLRTPLNAVKMAGSLIARGQLPDQHPVFATKIVTAADRMNRMISDLLDFASARSGSLKIERTRVDLAQVCQQVVDELRMGHRDRIIAYDATGNGAGEWDPERIAQVVSNLGSNAIKYSPPDSTVEIRLRGTDDCVDIDVHNGGPPIPEQEQREIFAPFRRGSTRAQGDSGLGLGLFIAQEMVRAHGGHIDVESDEQHGTTFKVCLPR